MLVAPSLPKHVQFSSINTLVTVLGLRRMQKVPKESGKRSNSSKRAKTQGENARHIELKGLKCSVCRKTKQGLSH